MISLTPEYDVYFMSGSIEVVFLFFHCFCLLLVLHSMVFHILFFNVYFIISISRQLSKSQPVFKTQLQNTSFLCHYVFYTYQNIFHSSSIFIYQYVHQFYSLVYSNTIRCYYKNHNIFYIYALSWLTDMHKRYSMCIFFKVRVDFSVYPYIILFTYVHKITFFLLISENYIGILCIVSYEYVESWSMWMSPLSIIN